MIAPWNSAIASLLRVLFRQRSFAQHRRLAVMPAATEALKTLEDMHFRCMTSLLGISRMCNRKKLLAITGAECMHERLEALNFRWAANAMRRDASFIVHHAIVDYRRAPITASSFNYAQEGNRLSREYELYRRAVQGQENALTPRQFARECRWQRAADLRSQFEEIPRIQEGPIAPQLHRARYRWTAARCCSGS